MREAFICDGIRTPIGRYGGALSSVRADDLAAIPLRELLVRNPRLDAECIDDVILGCANQAGEDNRNVARMATLLAGLPQSVSGTTINRLCGSGLDALGFAARAIKAGDGDLLIAGGVESMSRAPFVMGKIIGAGVGSVVTEWRRLWRLRQRAHERDEARDLLHSHGTGKGRAFCEKLAQQAGIDQSHPALQRWYASIHETQNDREVVSLYAHLVQPVLDAQARREISRSAAESTLMIAVSPLALVDMAFIAWRNLRLINRIATLYGIELGYYSRLRLFKLVLLNIAFAGASELVREVGMDWMSQDLAARLSTRAAQGIGAGLLTARLGIKAMELCRPLPWIDDDKPRLGDFRRQLIGQVKETLQKGKTPSEK
ncbi:TIGR01620 family protein [Escherichia coli]